MKVLSLISIEFYKNIFTESDQKSLEGLCDVDFEMFPLLADKSDKEVTEIYHQYDVLLGGWGSPRLPHDYTPAKTQLYCMTTGTVAAQMEPEHVERGLRLTNWGDAISQYISESALMQILSAVRMVGLHYDATHVKKSWTRDIGIPDSQSLFDRNVGLLGCGIIAQKLVPLLRPFNVNVFCYDPYAKDEMLIELGVTRLDSVEALFTQCDIISNHSAKTEETNDLINAQMLSLLPDHGVVVNTARGNSLDEEALAAEHKKGRLFSALDVFKEEPLAEDHPLRDEPRCLIMCHQAGPTRDGYHKMGERALENITRFKNGDSLLGELTGDHLRRMT